MYETFFPKYYQGQRDKNFVLFKKLKTNLTARITYVRRNWSQGCL